MAITGIRKRKKELGSTEREIATAFIHERYLQYFPPDEVQESDPPLKNCVKNFNPCSV
jgi:hypothetical protein